MSEWDFIEQAAHRLGVGDEALRKWRVRGVPGRWRLPIAELAAAGGMPFATDAFDRPPGPRRSRRADILSDRLAATAGSTQRNQGDRIMTPEDHIRARAPRPFTGAEYIESL